MPKKYSDIRKKLQIEVDKSTDNGLAHLTHYFQNHKNGVSQYFKPAAEKYLIYAHLTTLRKGFPFQSLKQNIQSNDRLF